MSPAEAATPARAAVTRALQLDPKQALAHSVLGYVQAAYDWSFDDAARSFELSLALDPAEPTCRQRYSHYLLTPSKRFAEASEQIQRALELDPLSMILKVSVGLPLYYGRDYDAAAECFERVVALDPTFGIAHYFLGLARAEQGALEGARDELRAALTLSPGSAEVTASLGRVLALLGEKSSARDLLASLKQRRQREFLPLSGLAEVCVGLGEYDQALDWLEQAADERDRVLVWLAVRPCFDPLRELDQFQRLVDRIGAPDPAAGLAGASGGPATAASARGAQFDRPAIGRSGSSTSPKRLVLASEASGWRDALSRVG